MGAGMSEGGTNKDWKQDKIGRHVFVSGPREIYLDRRMKNLRNSILKEIHKQGFKLTAFETPEGGCGHAERVRWSPESVIEVMRACVGVVLLGFPVAWSRKKEGENEEGLASEYCHYEGALAVLLRLPVLALIEEGTAERGVFGDKSGFQKLAIPRGSTTRWLKRKEFKEFLGGWIENDLHKRRDLFLAYSSDSKPLANTLRTHLERKRNPANSGKLRTLDWDRDFVRGGNLFREIERAAESCSAAIMLFTKKDQLLAKGEAEQASALSIPPDNVIFEAGYFAHAKSKPRVLIVLEREVKLPSDLKGDLHLEFDRAQGDTFDQDVLDEIDDWVDKRIWGVD